MGPSAFCSQSRLIFSDARSERRGFICTEGVPDLQKVMYPLSPTADPDGTAWISIASSPELGNEIGDICHGIPNARTRRKAFETANEIRADQVLRRERSPLVPKYSKQRRNHLGSERQSPAERFSKTQASRTGTRHLFAR